MNLVFKLAPVKKNPSSQALARPPVPSFPERDRGFGFVVGGLSFSRAGHPDGTTLRLTPVRVQLFDSSVFIQPFEPFTDFCYYCLYNKAILRYNSFCFRW